MTLRDVKVGSTVKVISVDESPIKQRLMSMGLIPNTRVEILSSAFLGDPISIRLRAYNLAIRKHDAEKILVAEG
ncbi:MAG: ferrous iron transport protein A [Selenomonadaceae bacterium]|nr:ferrous iron transport protein A [Selenomonadaceae bacterium]